MNVSFNMLEEMFYRQPVEKVCHWLRQCNSADHVQTQTSRLRLVMAELMALG